MSRDSDLSPGDVELLESVRRELRRVMKRDSTCHEIIELALRNVQRDLHSRRKMELIEDLEREIAYRHWCTDNIKTMPAMDEATEARPRIARDRRPV